MKHTQLGLLKTRRFLPIFITQCLGALNDNLFKNALVILITYRLAEAAKLNAQILVTLCAGIFILPFFTFSATAGQLADKYEKSKLIVIIKSIEIVLMFMALAGFYLHSISLLMTVLFLLGTHAAFFGPLKYAILPDLLESNELIAGNGMVEAGTFMSILLGTIVGGALILLPYGEYIISGLIIPVAIAGWASSLFVLKTNSHNPALKINYNIVKETFHLIAYARKHWDIALCILGISWFWLVGATFLAEFPVFAKDVLRTNENIVTLFLATFSIGLAIGSLLCNKLLRGKVHATYVPLGVLGMTVFMIDLCMAANSIIPENLSAAPATLIQFIQTWGGWRITLDFFFVAICAGIYTVPLYAMLQKRTEKEHRARVIASNNVVNALFMVFAAVATVAMLKFGITVPQVFLIVAIANGIVAIYICKLLPDILIKGFFRWAFTSLYRVKVKGLENYHNAGNRVVLIANHTSFIDAILLATFLPDKLSFAINTVTAKQWCVKIFLRLVNTYHVDPTNPMAIKSLIEFVQQDKRCVIFPEGRLTMTGALMKIYEGPGLVADKSGAKLLPICIQGAQRTPFSRLRGKVRIRWMPSITITIFPPQVFEIEPYIKGRKRREKIGHMLHDLMTTTVFESCDYHETLFDSLLDARSMQGRHREIIEDINRQPLSYQEFITRCFILGNAIAKKTQPSEYVGVMLPNTTSNVITFFALQAYCRVPAMLNYTSGIYNVVTACKTANIKTVYTSREFVQVAKLTKITDALVDAGITVHYLEDLRTHINLLHKLKGKLFATFPRLAYQYIVYQCYRSTGLPPESLGADSPASVLFTSGSEGTPKGVVLSHTNIQANRFQLTTSIDFAVNDKVFNALPLFHSFGLTSGMILPLLSGINLFLYPSPLHYRIIPELVYDTNATILFGTDFFLSGYAKYAHQYDFYSVRYVFAGAERLREETREHWSQKFGVRIFEGYGTTETSPVISTNTPMKNEAGTVGRLLPSMRYRLKSVPGILEGGILCVAGPNVMKGYLLANHPGVLVPPEDGWHETGDLVTIDDKGFVTIKGRLKRFAKIAGEMVSLAMVEQRIHELWPTYQHAVISVVDSRKGEQLLLITTNPEATRENVVNFAKLTQMAEISIPRKIIICKEMPFLATGKVDYHALTMHYNAS